jgi:hypothetical protein
MQQDNGQINGWFKNLLKNKIFRAALGMLVGGPVGIVASLAIDEITKDTAPSTGGGSGGSGSGSPNELAQANGIRKIPKTF